MGVSNKHCLLSLFSLVLFRLLSGHLLGNSCSLDRPYVFFVFCLFVLLVISHSGFEGWLWVLIASVADLCILFTYTLFYPSPNPVTNATTHSAQ